jgi:outer membrane protein OmpA-like peptidoglycan-associated protein
MRAPIAIALVAPLVIGSLPAAAQNPSADQIINSLRPSGNLVTGGTRGIRLAPGGNGAVQSQVAPATESSSSKPAAAPTNPAVNLTVNFATNSAELTPDALRTLDELGRALASRDLAGYRFRIEGHTDTVGTHDYNQGLSERRAEAVVHYVAKKFGVEPGRLQAVGMGETGLLVQTPPQTPEPRNRRVQVINLGA